MSKRTIALVMVVLLACTGLAWRAFKRAPAPATEGSLPGEIPVANDGKTGDKAGHAAAPADKPLFDGWEKPAVAIVFSGEQHGYIEPCGCSVNQLGGLSRRADLIEQMRDKDWTVTALDVGGLVNNPSRQQGKFKCDMVLKCLTDMRYAAVAMGTEELQLSFDFISFHKPDELPFLAANIVLFDDPNFTGGPLPRKVIAVGGLKIGVTAVFGPELEDTVRPGGQGAGDFEFKVLDPVESLRKQVAALETEKPDLLVLLSHCRKKETEKIAAEFPQFDIVVTAGGIEDPDPRPTFLGKKTLLVAPGQKGKHVPVVGYFPAAGKERERLKYEVVDLDEKRFRNPPNILEHMRYYQVELLQKCNLVATEPPIDDPRNVDPLTGLPVDAEKNPFVGAKVCGECHKSAYEVWLTTRHAQATEDLKTGGPRGTKEWVNRMFDPECIACHVTGWDPKRVVRYKTGYEDEKTTPQLTGQSCENCHGPGGRHTELERAWAKDHQTTDEVTAWRKFHRLNKKTAFDLCVKCHDGDNDPHFGSDSFDKYWDEIAHPGKD
ncbi:MAG: multiheme c-type cytochrome [Deltaproteobacteria bacterium]